MGGSAAKFPLISYEKQWGKYLHAQHIENSTDSTEEKENVSLLTPKTL